MARGQVHSFGGEADAIVLDGEFEPSVSLMRGETHQAGVVSRFDAVPEGVLDQGLQEQSWHLACEGCRFGFPFDSQLIAESSLLDVEITLDQLQFLGEGNFLPLGLTEGKAQQFAK